MFRWKLLQYVIPNTKMENVWEWLKKQKKITSSLALLYYLHAMWIQNIRSGVLWFKLILFYSLRFLYFQVIIRAKIEILRCVRYVYDRWTMEGLEWEQNSISKVFFLKFNLKDWYNGKTMSYYILSSFLDTQNVFHKDTLLELGW